MLKVLIFTLIFVNTACAYRLGLSERTLPGGYAHVAIPVFKNTTQETGIEMPFTNALIRRFARSQVARVSDKESAPLLLEGTITKVVTQEGPMLTNSVGGLRTLPDEAVITTEYLLRINANLILRRKSDDKIVWQGNFSNQKVYPAPRIGTPVINSANATYNQSARMEYISRLAEEMMAEAHDRMTENF